MDSNKLDLNQETRFIIVCFEENVLKLNVIVKSFHNS
jgi:hypothetical protein